MHTITEMVFTKIYPCSQVTHFNSPAADSPHSFAICTIIAILASTTLDYCKVLESQRKATPIEITFALIANGTDRLPNQGDPPLE